LYEYLIKEAILEMNENTDGWAMNENTDVWAMNGPPLWSSGQSSWLLTQRSRVRFSALPDFLGSSGSGTGPTQPLWGWMRSYLKEK
jgi:hypothetical protein